MAKPSSSKLREKLVKDGFYYTILRRNLNDIRWKCSVTSCKGKISTNLLKPYKVFFKLTSHNHGPKQLDDKIVCAIYNEKSCMKQCTINNEENTKQIRLSVTHGCNDTVCSKLENSGTLRRTIRRARRKYVPDEPTNLLFSLPDKWETTMGVMDHNIVSENVVTMEIDHPSTNARIPIGGLPKTTLPNQMQPQSSPQDIGQCESTNGLPYLMDFCNSIGNDCNGKTMSMPNTSRVIPMRDPKITAPMETRNPSNHAQMCVPPTMMMTNQMSMPPPNYPQNFGQYGPPSSMDFCNSKGNDYNRQTMLMPNTSGAPMETGNPSNHAQMSVPPTMMMTNQMSMPPQNYPQNFGQYGPPSSMTFRNSRGNDCNGQTMYMPNTSEVIPMRDPKIVAQMETGNPSNHAQMCVPPTMMMTNQMSMPPQNYPQNFGQYGPPSSMDFRNSKGNDYNRQTMLMPNTSGAPMETGNPSNHAQMSVPPTMMMTNQMSMPPQNYPQNFGQYGPPSSMTFRNSRGNDCNGQTMYMPNTSEVIPMRDPKIAAQMETGNPSNHAQMCVPPTMMMTNQMSMPPQNYPQNFGQYGPPSSMDFCNSKGNDYNRQTMLMPNTSGAPMETGNSSNHVQMSVPPTMMMTNQMSMPPQNYPQNFGEYGSPSFMDFCNSRGNSWNEQTMRHPFNHAQMCEQIPMSMPPQSFPQNFEQYGPPNKNMAYSNFRGRGRNDQTMHMHNNSAINHTGDSGMSRTVAPMEMEHSLNHVQMLPNSFQPFPSQKLNTPPSSFPQHFEQYGQRSIGNFGGKGWNPGGRSEFRNLRPRVLQNVMERDKDNWMNNNLHGEKSGYDPQLEEHQPLWNRRRINQVDRQNNDQGSQWVADKNGEIPILNDNELSDEIKEDGLNKNSKNPITISVDKQILGNSDKPEEVTMPILNDNELYDKQILVDSVKPEEVTMPIVNDNEINNKIKKPEENIKISVDKQILGYSVKLEESTMPILNDNELYDKQMLRDCVKLEESTMPILNENELYDKQILGDSVKPEEVTMPIVNDNEINNKIKKPEENIKISVDKQILGYSVKLEESTMPILNDNELYDKQMLRDCVKLEESTMPILNENELYDKQILGDSVKPEEVTMPIVNDNEINNKIKKPEENIKISVDKQILGYSVKLEESTMPILNDNELYDKQMLRDCVKLEESTMPILNENELYGKIKEGGLKSEDPRTLSVDEEILGDSVQHNLVPKVKNNEFNETCEDNSKIYIDVYDPMEDEPIAWIFRLKKEWTRGYSVQEHEIGEQTRRNAVFRKYH